LLIRKVELRRTDITRRELKIDVEFDYIFC